MMKNAVAMMTTMAISGGLKSTGCFDGRGEDDSLGEVIEGGGSRSCGRRSKAEWWWCGDGAGAIRWRSMAEGILNVEAG